MSNRIFVLLRTRDEEYHIGKFLESYPPENIEKILISDGLSTDKTVEIAQTYPKTYFKPFNEIVYGDKGIFRQHEAKHHNFLEQWALDEGAQPEDWIVADDTDSFPTKALIQHFTNIFNCADQQGKLGISAYHIYLWRQDQYFPNANRPGPIVYAWKVKCGVRWDENEAWGVVPINLPSMNQCYHLTNPYALIHNFTATPEITEKKYKFYKDCNRMNGIKPIYELFGPAAPRESWMY